MITTKDKIKLKKPMGVFTNVGEVCSIVGIAEDGVISFRFGQGHLGCMSYDELDKYFEVIPGKVGWSEWIPDKVEYIDSYGAKYSCPVYYRYNNKRVEMKGSGLRSKSSCSPVDIFDLDVGLKIAELRFIKKLIGRNIDDEIKAY